MTEPTLDVTVTVVDAFCPPLVAAAVTAQDPVDAGAVYNPPLVIDPQPATHVAAALAVN